MSVSQSQDYFNYILQIVRAVIEHREYKGTIPEALKSINQYFPTVSYKDNEKAFKNVFEVYLKSVELINKKEKKFWEFSQANNLDALIDQELKTFKKIDVPKEILKPMLQYIFYNKFQKQ
ncbi:MAG: hypothetical protein HeimC3_03370 [Candidatus Heimdallarchaeota archaeon LC_3]|nr:MAG: hypothetical protein HeimC3_03370 [Candidatus Heimdallarchaeota archaeon LC_3]